MLSDPAPAYRPSTSSTLVHHTVPPYYACYLLRSFNPKRSATYIGSTPHPPRRIQQHNGVNVGGAHKTRLGRPWEMELLVHGFPTKVQALQFEWAWQNPHLSRHLRADVLSLKSQRPLPQFPRSTLSNTPLAKTQVLQFMLTARPWRSFRLQVLHLSEDSARWWKEARLAGPVHRTVAAQRKAALATVVDAWGRERGGFLDTMLVTQRFEGVDGARLVRRNGAEEGEDIEKMKPDDGTSRALSCAADVRRRVLPPALAEAPAAD